MPEPKRFTINDRQFEANELPAVSAESETSFTVSHDGKTYDIYVNPDGSLSDGYSLSSLTVSIETQKSRLIEERFAGKVGGSGPDGNKQHTLKAPMPGLVKKILVSVGDTVSKETPLFILEAMKMENVLTAGRPGVITEVKVSEGKNVEKNTALSVIAEA